MNFLQLCQRTAGECGVSGTITTTVGQIGSLGRIVNWVGDAWNEIQTIRDDWDWMRSSNILGAGVSFVPAAAQFNTTLGSGLGIAVDAFGKWDEQSFRCYTTTNAGGAVGIGATGAFVIGGGVGTLDETFLDCISFDDWRDTYMFGAMRNVQTRPVVIAVGPDQSLNLGPPPNGLYTVTGDYWLAPSLMANDTDVPLGLPLRWHMLICYKAMMKYGLYESAGDVVQRAQSEWSIMFPQVEARRLPRMGFAGSL